MENLQELTKALQTVEGISANWDKENNRTIVTRSGQTLYIKDKANGCAVENANGAGYVTTYINIYALIYVLFETL